MAPINKYENYVNEQIKTRKENTRRIVREIR